MSAFTVTIRRLGKPDLGYRTVGTTSAAVAEKAARKYGACGISVKPSQGGK
jgi:hypothetical protein